MAEGLDHYGHNEVELAVECWRRAVEVQPTNQQALDYLDAAGFQPVEAPSGAQVIDISTARRILTPLPPAPNPEEAQAARMGELERLLEGKRYEEALELLLRARFQFPGDASISRGIRLLKDRLLLDYVRRLGDLEQVPIRVESNAPSTEPESEIFELVDGIASIEDILQSSRLGRFETYRCLTRLLEADAIALTEAAPWSLPVAAPGTRETSAASKPSHTDTQNPQQGTPMSNISESLQQLNNLDGFVGASLVDSDSGMVLGMEGGANYNLELASAMNTDVVRCKRKAMDALGLGDQIDDILITLKDQYHIIRPVKNRPQVFIYLVTERSRSNLALARMRLAEVDGALKV